MSRQYAIDPIKLAAGLGIEPEERDALLTGSEHPYNCRCDTCREWWKLMGPDPETGKCGPFTMEELGLDPADYPEAGQELDNGIEEIKAQINLDAAAGIKR